jgi:hypothetical protein
MCSLSSRVSHTGVRHQSRNCDLGAFHAERRLGAGVPLTQVHYSLDRPPVHPALVGGARNFGSTMHSRGRIGHTVAEPQLRPLLAEDAKDRLREIVEGFLSAAQD